MGKEKLAKRIESPLAGNPDDKKSSKTGEKKKTIQATVLQRVVNRVANQRLLL